jgi:chemotaxis protein methyltransferase CheR
MNRQELYLLYAAYILQHAGIVYDEMNFYQLDSRIESLKKTLALKSDADLLNLLRVPLKLTELHRHLIDFSTNNETYFFRDPKVFATLKSQIFASLEATWNQPLRIWSLASSSGQEACSTIMAFDQYSGGRLSQIQVDCGDISSQMVARGKAGIFSQLEVQRGLPITDLIKYFEPEGDQHWKFKSEYLDRAQFFQFNMLSDPFPNNRYHIVFCRNVLIYQNMDRRREIINQISKSLLPGGFCILGGSENLMNISSEFTQMTLDGYAFFRKSEMQNALAG